MASTSQPIVGSGGGAPSSLRPWERAAAVVPMRPNAAKSRGPGAKNRGGIPLGGDAPGVNMVGPARRIEQHQKEREKQIIQAGKEELAQHAKVADGKPLPTKGQDLMSRLRAELPEVSLVL